MICVEIKGKSLVCLKGHANQNKSGNDLVCAAISSIVQSSASWFIKKDIKCDAKPKIPMIQLEIINLSQKNIDKLTLLIKQLKFMQKQYPKYIKIIRS